MRMTWNEFHQSPTFMINSLTAGLLIHKSKRDHFKELSQFTFRFVQPLNVFAELCQTCFETTCKIDVLPIFKLKRYFNALLQ